MHTSPNADAGTHSFLANYSSVVIEVDAVYLDYHMGEGGLLNCAWCLFYCSETFWVRTTAHKTKALSLISAIHH